MHPIRSLIIALFACLLLAPPASAAIRVGDPDTDAVALEVSNFQCVLLCEDTDVFILNFLANPEPVPGQVIVYVVWCDIGGGVRMVQASLSGYQCVVGSPNCDDFTCMALAVPPDDVWLPQPEPEVVTLSTSAAAVCSATVDAYLDGNPVVSGLQVLVPCALDK